MTAITDARGRNVVENIGQNYFGRHVKCKRDDDNTGGLPLATTINVKVRV